MTMIYLDASATQPIRRSAKEAMLRSMEETWANSSSVHRLGRKAATRLAEAREEFAALIGAKPSEVYFTSGGSESNAIILEQLLFPRAKAPHWMRTTLEHPSITGYSSLFKSLDIQEHVVKPGNDGYLKPEDFVAKLTPETRIVSLIAVHNVLGTVQPWMEIAEAVKQASERDVWVHTDAVQALGKVPFSVAASALDSASFGGHKVGAPKGIGALWSRKPPQVLSAAGGQEFGVRGGTTPLSLICSFVAAASEAVHELEAHQQEIIAVRRYLYESLSAIDGIRILSPREEVTPVLCFSTNSLPSEVAVRILADQDIYVSPGGSACHSNKKSAASDLSAMGISLSPKEDQTKLRASWASLSMEDAETFVEAIRAMQRRAKI